MTCSLEKFYAARRHDDLVSVLTELQCFNAADAGMKTGRLGWGSVTALYKLYGQVQEPIVASAA